jgi:hypothetical protein
MSWWLQPDLLADISVKVVGWGQCENWQQVTSRCFQIAKHVASQGLEAVQQLTLLQGPRNWPNYVKEHVFPLLSLSCC